MFLELNTIGCSLLVFLSPGQKHVSAPEAGSAGPGIAVGRILHRLLGTRARIGGRALEQLAGGDATFSELAQPRGARLPALSRHPARSRGRGTSGNDAGRPAAILVGAFRRPRRKGWLNRFGCYRRGEAEEPPEDPGPDWGQCRGP